MNRNYGRPSINLNRSAGLITKVIIGSLILFWMIIQSKPALIPYLAFMPHEFLNGKFTNAILYPFVEPSLISILFQSLMLFFIGSQYESELGRNKYIKLLLVTTLSGSAFALLSYFVGLPMVLSSIYSFVLTLFLLHASRNPTAEVMFFFIFKMKMITMIYISLGLLLLVGIFQGQASVWGTLFSIIVGFSYIKGFKSLGFLIPSTKFTSTIKNKFNKKNNFTVIRNNGKNYKKDNIVSINRPKGPPKV